MDQQAHYDRDYYAWTQDQAARLRRLADARANLDLDLENLAEEVESMGRSDLREVESLIANVMAHLLKLEISPSTEPREHWRREIAAWRGDIRRALRSSPSLRGRIDLADTFDGARRRAAIGLLQDGLGESDLPEACPYALDDVLRDGWAPASRHGF